MNERGVVVIGPNSEFLSRVISILNIMVARKEAIVEIYAPNQIKALVRSVFVQRSQALYVVFDNR